MLQIVEGNSDIELSEEEKEDGNIEGECRGERDVLNSSKDEGSAGQEQAEEDEETGPSSSSSRRLLWRKTFTLSYQSISIK